MGISHPALGVLILLTATACAGRTAISGNDSAAAQAVCEQRASEYGSDSVVARAFATTVGRVRSVEPVSPERWPDLDGGATGHGLLPGRTRPHVTSPRNRGEIQQVQGFCDRSLRPTLHCGSDHAPMPKNRLVDTRRAGRPALQCLHIPVTLVSLIRTPLPTRSAHTGCALMMSVLAG